MTKLETEIARAMESADRESSKRFTSEDYAKAAAGACIKWLRQAFEDGQLSVNTQHGEFEETFEEWANENGVI